MVQIRGTCDVPDLNIQRPLALSTIPKKQDDEHVLTTKKFDLEGT